MKNEKKQKWFLILGMVFSIIFMNFPSLYTSLYHEFLGKPTAKEAVIHLNDNKVGKRIYLDGEWEFYHNKFIITDSLMGTNPDFYINVPDSWSKYEVNGKKLPAEGFGSYKLTIQDFYPQDTITVSIPDFAGAYRIYIDGKLASQSGTLSKNSNEIFTTPKSTLYPVSIRHSATHQLVVEVATTRFSGLYMTPILDDYHNVSNKNILFDAIRFVLFGIALFALFGLIIIYFLTIKQKLHSFWLPVMIFFILFRIMLTSEFYSVWQSVVFFNLSYESTNELMYLTTFVLKYLTIFLIQEQCGIKFSRKEIIGFLIYYSYIYSIYLLTPYNIYNQYLSVVVPLLTYVLDIYLFYKMYKNRKTMKKFGFIIYWNTVIMIVGLTIDSYYLNGKIYMDMSLVMILFFTVFLLIISLVFSMRMGDLYDDFTKSKLRLTVANNQIQMQKAYYEALNKQMNEVREIKHDVRHFIGGMQRLAEDNQFVELKTFLNEYCKKTDLEQLPIFCENIVANSIIGFYFLQAKKKGISFESQCRIQNDSRISDIDFCIILGNALENAIEACMRQKENKKYIIIQVNTLKKQKLIKITNSFNGEFEIKDEKYISKKEGKSHGLGILSIKKVVESYKGILKIETAQNEFMLMVSILENEI